MHHNLGKVHLLPSISPFQEPLTTSRPTIRYTTFKYERRTILFTVYRLSMTQTDSPSPAGWNKRRKRPARRSSMGRCGCSASGVSRRQPCSRSPRPPMSPRGRSITTSRPRNPSSRNTCGGPSSGAARTAWRASATCPIHARGKSSGGAFYAGIVKPWTACRLTCARRPRRVSSASPAGRMRRARRICL
jgi:hypothetical protein